MAKMYICLTQVFKKIPLSSATICVCILISIGFYLRSEFLMNTTVLSPAIRADARDYFTYSYNLKHKHVYSRDLTTLEESGASVRPDAMRNPGYPLFMLPFMWSEFPTVIVTRVQFAQVILSSFMIFLIFFIFLRFLPVYWAAIAALLTALCPHLIVLNVYLLTETLFAFLLVLPVLFMNRACSTFRAGAVGALFGIACLVRPILQYFPTIISCWLFISDSGRKKQAAAFMLGFLVVVSPWYFRNMISVGIFADDALKINFLHHGMYPNFMYEGRQETYGIPYRFDPRSTEISRTTGTVLSEIVNRFKQDPISITIWYLIQKPIEFWSWNNIEGQGDVFVYPVIKSPYSFDPIFISSYQLMKLVHLPFVYIGLLTCVLIWLPAINRSIKPESLFIIKFISLLILYFVFLHMIGAPYPRYSVPVRPFLYGMAIFGLTFLFNLETPQMSSYNEFIKRFVLKKMRKG